MTDTLMQRLADEADHARQDGAADIAILIDDAVYEIVRQTNNALQLNLQVEQQAAEIARLISTKDYIRKEINAMAARVEDDAVLIAALRADAERYRAIRQPNGLLWPIAVFDMRDRMNKDRPLPHECIGETLDAAIDAALRQEQPAGEPKP